MLQKGVTNGYFSTSETKQNVTTTAATKQDKRTITTQRHQSKQAATKL